MISTILVCTGLAIVATSWIAVLAARTPPAANIGMICWVLGVLLTLLAGACKFV